MPALLETLQGLDEVVKSRVFEESELGLPERRENRD